MSVSPYPIEPGALRTRQARDFRVVPALGDRAALPFIDQFTSVLPSSLAGCTVLDAGGDDGVRAIEMKRRGAARVVVIGNEQGALPRDVEHGGTSVYDLGSSVEDFDVVIFDGPLHRLRHPLLALDILRQVARGTMLFRSPDATDDVAGATRDRDPLMYLAGEALPRRSSWWLPNRACVEAMLGSAGFAIEDRAHDGIYVCRPA